MAVRIAGRAVRPGDRLYHKGYETWGYVTRYDPSGSAEFVIRGTRGERKLLIQQNGVINGRRMVYWHQPIELDLPYANVQSIQTVVDTVALELASNRETDGEDE